MVKKGDNCTSVIAAKKSSTPKVVLKKAGTSKNKKCNKSPQNTKKQLSLSLKNKTVKVTPVKKKVENKPKKVNPRKKEKDAETTEIIKEKKKKICSKDSKNPKTSILKGKAQGMTPKKKCITKQKCETEGAKTTTKEPVSSIHTETPAPDKSKTKAIKVLSKPQNKGNTKGTLKVIKKPTRKVADRNEKPPKEKPVKKMSKKSSKSEQQKHIDSVIENVIKKNIPLENDNVKPGGRKRKRDSIDSKVQKKKRKLEEAPVKYEHSTEDLGLHSIDYTHMLDMTSYEPHSPQCEVVENEEASGSLDRSFPDISSEEQSRAIVMGSEQVCDSLGMSCQECSSEELYNSMGFVQEGDCEEHSLGSDSEFDYSGPEKMEGSNSPVSNAGKWGMLTDVLAFATIGSTDEDSSDSEKLEENCNRLETIKLLDGECGSRDDEDFEKNCNKVETANFFEDESSSDAENLEDNCNKLEAAKLLDDESSSDAENLEDNCNKLEAAKLLDGDLGDIQSESLIDIVNNNAENKNEFSERNPFRPPIIFADKESEEDDGYRIFSSPEKEIRSQDGICLKNTDGDLTLSSPAVSHQFSSPNSKSSSDASTFIDWSKVNKSKTEIPKPSSMKLPLKRKSDMTNTNKPLIKHNCLDESHVYSSSSDIFAASPEHLECEEKKSKEPQRNNTGMESLLSRRTECSSNTSTPSNIYHLKGCKIIIAPCDVAVKGTVTQHDFVANEDPGLSAKNYNNKKVSQKIKYVVGEPFVDEDKTNQSNNTKLPIHCYTNKQKNKRRNLWAEDCENKEDTLTINLNDEGQMKKDKNGLFSERKNLTRESPVQSERWFNRNQDSFLGIETITSEYNSFLGLSFKTSNVHEIFINEIEIARQSKIINKKCILCPNDNRNIELCQGFSSLENLFKINNVDLLIEEDIVSTNKMLEKKSLSEVKHMHLLVNEFSLTKQILLEEKTKNSNCHYKKFCEHEIHSDLLLLNEECSVFLENCDKIYERMSPNWSAPTTQLNKVKSFPKLDTSPLSSTVPRDTENTAVKRPKLSKAALLKRNTIKHPIIRNKKEKRLQHQDLENSKALASEIVLNTAKEATNKNIKTIFNYSLNPEQSIKSHKLPVNNFLNDAVSKSVIQQKTLSLQSNESVKNENKTRPCNSDITKSQTPRMPISFHSNESVQNKPKPTASCNFNISKSVTPKKHITFEGFKNTSSATKLCGSDNSKSVIPQKQNAYVPYNFVIKKDTNKLSPSSTTIVSNKEDSLNTVPTIIPIQRKHHQIGCHYQNSANHLNNLTKHSSGEQIYIAGDDDDDDDDAISLAPNVELRKFVEKDLYGIPETSITKKPARCSTNAARICISMNPQEDNISSHLRNINKAQEQPTSSRVGHKTNVPLDIQHYNAEQCDESRNKKRNPAPVRDSPSVFCNRNNREWKFGNLRKQISTEETVKNSDIPLRSGNKPGKEQKNSFPSQSASTSSWADENALRNENATPRSSSSLNSNSQLIHISYQNQLNDTPFENYCLSYLRTSVGKNQDHPCSLKHEVPECLFLQVKDTEEVEHITRGMDAILKNDFNNPPLRLITGFIKFCMKNNKKSCLIRLGLVMKTNITLKTVNEDNFRSIWELFITDITESFVLQNNSERYNCNSQINYILGQIFGVGDCNDYLKVLNVILEGLATLSKRHGFVKLLSCVEFLREQNFPAIEYPFSFVSAVLLQVRKFKNKNEINNGGAENSTLTKFVYKVYKTFFDNMDSCRHFYKLNRSLIKEFLDYAQLSILEVGSKLNQLKKEDGCLSEVNGPGPLNRAHSSFANTPFNNARQQPPDDPNLMEFQDHSARQARELKETASQMKALFEKYRAMKNASQTFLKYLIDFPEQYNENLDDVTMSFIVLANSENQWSHSYSLYKGMKNFNPQVVKDFVDENRTQASRLFLVIDACLKSNHEEEAIKLFIQSYLHKMDQNMWLVNSSPADEPTWRNLCDDIRNVLNSQSLPIEILGPLFAQIISHQKSLEEPIDVKEGIDAFFVRAIQEDNLPVIATTASTIVQNNLLKKFVLNEVQYYRVLVIALVRCTSASDTDFVLNTNGLMKKSNFFLRVYSTNSWSSSSSLTIYTCLCEEEMLALYKFKERLCINSNSNLQITFEKRHQTSPLPREMQNYFEGMDCSVAGAMKRFRTMCTKISEHLKHSFIVKGENVLEVDRIVLLDGYHH